MSYILWKNVHRCFPGFKCLPPLPSPSKDQEHDADSSSWSPVSTSTATVTPTSVLAKNYFNSVYDLTSDQSSTSKSFTPSTVATDDLLSSSDDSDVAHSAPDFATVYASQRFFFSSPGPSNSIVESAAESAAATPAAAPKVEAEAKTESLAGAGGVAVHKYSPDPYLDFRRSMQEMVEARDLRDVRGDWEYLHELLLCYLRLNPKHIHKSIVDAFTDLIISLMALPEADKSRKAGRRRRQRGGSMG
ncbi:hypothetical protein BT93_H2115 [Corymbia citriodora subsp. variegata]|nr:hypothetical protein BT93_H2115 [Corymbia citriodora subsp. variegata]